MLIDSLYHPPHITLDTEKSRQSDTLYLVHNFEEKPLLRDYIPNTMLGLEYLWGGPVSLETHEVKSMQSIGDHPIQPAGGSGKGAAPEIKWEHVVYTMKERKLRRETIE